MLLYTYILRQSNLGHRNTANNADQLLGVAECAGNHPVRRPWVSHGDGAGDSKHRHADTPVCSLLL